VNLSSGGTPGISADQSPSGDYELQASDDVVFPSEESETYPDAASAEQDLPSRSQVKRYSVLAARYRLTLKGPERGAWDFEITHEADAPLETVERVARGVARRSGDEGQPEHLTASDIRATLAQPWWSGAQ
jgi:hypothetical protein